jgi:hypothetical protein
MADESSSPAVLPAVLDADLAAGAPPLEESSTRGMLRDAIHKVMEEIEYHEREANKHTQKAAELRKDLRESFAFLQEKKADAKPPKPAEQSRLDTMVDSVVKGKAKDAAADKPQRAGGRKEPPAAKGKKK